MDPLTLAVLGIAGLVALTRRARPQSPAAATTGPASSDSGPRYVSAGGVAVYPGRPAPQLTDAQRAAQIAQFEADARAREQAQLAQSAAALNQIIPGAGTAVKFLSNAAEALGLASPIYHFEANFDPYDWIATHHFDVLAVEVQGVLDANRAAGDQGPGMGEVHGPPITPLQGFWIDHSKLGALAGERTVDEVRAAMPPAPPRGFGNPLPIAGAATWQEVVRNMGEWPPPPPVDPNTIAGPTFVAGPIAKVIDGVRLQDWRDAGGGKPAALRHPEQFYAKHPELAPAAAAAPALAAPAPASSVPTSGVLGIVAQVQAIAAAAAAAAAAPAPAPVQLPPPPASTLPPISLQAVLRGTVIP